MKTILIIEDDKEIAELESDYLKASGFSCVLVDDGNKGYETAIRDEYALILLDIMVPNMDGFEICRRIRKHTMVPIIIISARREDQDKIDALGLGANDFIMKPFAPREMVARVKAHIENFERLTGMNLEAPQMLELRELRINTSSHEVFVRGTNIILPNKEYELLLFLAKHVNTVFSKKQLFETIWGMDAIGEINTVTVHINRIREKIELDSSHPTYIETVWGSGYRMKF